jgi:hypothetical protein
LEKVAQGAPIEALQASLVTVDESEFGAESEGLQGAGEADNFSARRLGGEGSVEDAFFEDPKAAETPMYDDYPIDEVPLLLAGGS